jgi:hypothetical protein
MTNRDPAAPDRFDPMPPAVTTPPDAPRTRSSLWGFAWLGALLAVLGILFAVGEWPEKTATGPNATPSTVGQGGGQMQPRRQGGESSNPAQPPARE